jgi:hypothetical protein
MNSLDQIEAALQAHLQNAEVVRLPGQTLSEVFRLPTDPIICRDGTKFSIQASEFTYCAPRDNQGPWTHVEVMTLTDGVTPSNWEHDAGDNLAGYVPIESVAKEILQRGFLSIDNSAD